MPTSMASVPVDYNHCVHTVTAHTMTRPGSQALRPQEFTLLELVQAVAEVTASEREIVAAVVHMLASGRVKLAGNFHNEEIEHFYTD